jgi:hypothetical protein
MISIKDLRNLKAFNKEDGEWYDVGEIHICAGGVMVYGTGVRIANGWVTCCEGYDHECQVDLYYPVDNGEWEQVL